MHVNFGCIFFNFIKVSTGHWIIFNNVSFLWIKLPANCINGLPYYAFLDASNRLHYIVTVYIKYCIIYLLSQLVGFLVSQWASTVPLSSVISRLQL